VLSVRSESKVASFEIFKLYNLEDKERGFSNAGDLIFLRLPNFEKYNKLKKFDKTDKITSS
jgi:hypothetical protein